MKKILTIISILLAGILLGALLLAIVYMLPLSEASPNAAASLEQLEAEGWYPAVPMITDAAKKGTNYNPGGILDNFTDSIMITTAARENIGRPLYQAMRMENSVMEKAYSYYWHGYVVLLRPLLCLMDYGEIRILNELMQFVLVLMLFVLIRRRKSMPWAMLSVSIYGLLLPTALRNSLQYSWVFYIVLVSSIIMLYYEKYWKQKQRIYVLFLLIGMLTAYLDLLTYPLITWAIPMIWWIMLSGEEQKEASRLVQVVGCGIFWILGYGGMWAGKWILAQLILGEPIIQTAWQEVMLRSGMENNMTHVSRLQVIMNNFRNCNSIQYRSILGAWFVWLAYQYVKKGKDLQPQKCLAYGLIAASTFVWYVVLHNHTYEHASYTYRIFTIFFVAVLAGFLSLLEGKAVAYTSNKKKWLHKTIGIVVIGIACVVALQDKVSVWQHNGFVEGVKLPLQDGQVVEQEFVPKYGELEALQLVMELKEGAFLVEVSQEGKLLWNTQVGEEQLGEGGFYELPVKLKVKENIPCCIRISLQGSKGSLATMQSGEMVLQEFKAIIIDDNPYNEQLQGGLVYAVRESSGKLFLNMLALIWLSGIVLLGLAQVVKLKNL